MHAAASLPPLSERDIARLQDLLDRVPAPLEPLDTSMLDGFLCGVLLQPQPVPPERWLRHVADVDGRALAAGYDAGPLHALVRRRHAELEAAVAARRWFDPWVFELEAGPQAGGESGRHAWAAAREAVYPWVAGFATAMELFPGLMRMDAKAVAEPLALLYRHLDADDLEDADDLLEIIESLEPPADMSQAVEELVRATLLLADVSRPRPPSQPPRPRSGPRR